MKKLILCLALTLSIFALNGCGGSDSNSISQKEYDAVVAERDELKEKLASLESVSSNKTNLSETESAPEISENKTPVQNSDAIKTGFDSESVINQIEVTPYYMNDNSNYRVYLVLKNNSPFTLNVQPNVTFYDSNNAIIGTKDNLLVAFAPNQESLLVFTNNDSYDHIDYKLQVKQDTIYQSTAENLTYEITEAKDKLIITVTNNGEIPSFYSGYEVLFFLGDSLVDYEMGYTVNSDQQLPPGEALSSECSTYGVTYDSYKIFLSGRDKQ